MFAAPTVVGDLVYVASCGGGIYAFDARTGAPRWRYDTGRDGRPANFHGDPLVAGDLLVIGGDKEPSASLYALDVRTGAPRWSEAFDGGVWGDVLSRGGAVLALTRRGDAVALDLASGRRVWTFDRAPRQVARPPGSPALVGNRFIFAARPHDLFALDTTSGALAWHVTLASTPATSVAVAAGSLVIGTRDGRFLRIDPATGSMLGGLEVGGRPTGAPVVASGGVYAIVGDALVCLDPTLARVRWRAANPGGWSSPRPLVRGGEVVVGDRAGVVVAFSLEGGEMWRLRLAGEVRGLGAFGDLLFVGTRTGRIYAVRLAQRPPSPP